MILLTWYMILWWALPFDIVLVLNSHIQHIGDRMEYFADSLAIASLSSFTYSASTAEHSRVNHRNEIKNNPNPTAQKNHWKISCVDTKPIIAIRDAMGIHKQAVQILQECPHDDCLLLIVPMDCSYSSRLIIPRNKKKGYVDSNAR
jgi:hypothetical protein